MPRLAVTDLCASALLAEAVTLLKTQSPTARLDAEVLLCATSGLEPIALIRDPDQLIANTAADEFRRLLARRAAGEPIAVILKQKEFWSMMLDLNEATLVPRPETEILVEAVLSETPEDEALSILDLGTGSGAIALALASERPRARITATDINSEALHQARENAKRHGLSVRFVLSDCFDALGDAIFDVVVSNPPYVKDHDDALEDSAARYDPSHALFAGSDGLDCIRRICKDASDYLVPGGFVALEHGFDQKDAVASLLSEAGFSAIKSIDDYAGLPRVTTARRAPA